MWKLILIKNKLLNYSRVLVVGLRARVRVYPWEEETMRPSTPPLPSAHQTSLNGNPSMTGNSDLSRWSTRTDLRQVKQRPEFVVLSYCRIIKMENCQLTGLNID